MAWIYYDLFSYSPIENIFVVSLLWLLEITLLRAFMYRFLHGQCFHFSRINVHEYKCWVM